MLFVLLANACKPDMVLVSICVEYNLSEYESLSLNCVFISRDVLYTDLLCQESQIHPFCRRCQH